MTGALQQPGPEAGRRVSVAAVLGIALLALAASANSRRGEMVHDDLRAVVGNASVTAFRVGEILTTASWWGQPEVVRYYRPLTTLTFAVNHQLHGLAPEGYHVVNILLHAAVSAVLVLLLARLGLGPGIALVAGALFAVHPVHVEAVASIVGRAELLSALLALLAWAAALHVQPQAGGRWIAISGLLAAGAVLSKEGAVMLALLIPVGDLVRGVRARWRVWAGPAAGVALAILVRLVVLRGFIPAIDPEDNILAGAPLTVRWLTALRLIAEQARLLFWPSRLSADYAFRQIEPTTSILAPGALAGLALVLGLGVALLLRRRLGTAVTLGLCWIVVTSILTSNIVIVIGTVLAERLLYLPSAGACLILAAGLAAVAGRLAPAVAGSPSRRAGALLALLAAVPVLLGAWRTFDRNRDWRSAVTFYDAMVRDAPRSARAHRERGLFLRNVGRMDEAVADLRISIEIDPDNYFNRHNLGVLHEVSGDCASAEAEYLRALARVPRFVDSMRGIANCASARGDEVTAEQWLRRAREIKPQDPAVLRNLANSLFRQGRLEEAAEIYGVAVVTAPGDALGHINFGTCLHALERRDEALAEFTRALEIDTSQTQAWVGMIACLAETGRRDEALSALDQAEAALPGNLELIRVRNILTAVPDS